MKASAVKCLLTDEEFIKNDIIKMHFTFYEVARWSHDRVTAVKKKCKKKS